MQIARIFYAVFSFNLLHSVCSYVLDFYCLWLIAVFCQIDEDIEGTIDFLAQTGPFSVPLQCLKKIFLVTFHLFLCCKYNWAVYCFVTLFVSFLFLNS